MPDDFAWLARPVPVLWITLDGNAPLPGLNLTKPMRPTGNIKVIQDHDGTPVTSIEGKTFALDHAILLEGRGSSSFTAGQRFMGPSGYNFEFHDGQRNGVGQALLGLPQNADWALVTCVADKTCIRNALTYSIAQLIANPAGRWVPRFRWVEVYFNGAYHGVYLLAERPKDDKFRVNLPNAADTAPPNEQGYLISADADCRAAYGYDPLDPKSEFLDARAVMSKPATGAGCPEPPAGMAGQPGFRVPGNRRWKIRSPNPDTKLTDPQRMYLKENFDSMTVALDNAAPNWKNLIDLPSFLDYFVISEFSNNVDAFYKSWYMYTMPDSANGGKWYMGPVWDFDLAYGNANYYLRHCATNTQLGPLVRASPADKDDPPPPWTIAPLKDMAVRNDLRCRWNQLRATGGPLDVAKIEQRIDSFVTHLMAAKTRDTAKWMNYPKYVWPNNFVANTWADDIRYLKFWIRRRLAWTDRNLAGTCAAPANAPAVTQVMPPQNNAAAARTIEMWGGESANRFPGGYVDIINAPAAAATFACPAFTP
jgi:CotH kinase protein